jgi:hypothetical protein
MVEPITRRCGDHRRFATEKIAQEQLSRIAVMHLREGSSTWNLLTVFECGDHWHIGRTRRRLYAAKSKS